jgi:hypothetical protein
LYGSALFPSEEAFLSQVPGNIEHGNMTSFLAQELAADHPELSAKFPVVYFHSCDINGAIQNLNFDPAIEEEVRRERAAAASENGFQDGTDAEGDVGG